MPIPNFSRDVECLQHTVLGNSVLKLKYLFPVMLSCTELFKENGYDKLVLIFISFFKLKNKVIVVIED
jgi:hypothetical protein